MEDFTLFIYRIVVRLNNIFNKFKFLNKLILKKFKIALKSDIFFFKLVYFHKKKFLNKLILRDWNFSCFYYKYCGNIFYYIWFQLLDLFSVFLIFGIYVYFFLYKFFSFPGFNFFLFRDFLKSAMGFLNFVLTRNFNFFHNVLLAYLLCWHSILKYLKYSIFVFVRALGLLIKTLLTILLLVLKLMYKLKLLIILIILLIFCPSLTLFIFNSLLTYLLSFLFDVKFDLVYFDLSGFFFMRYDFSFFNFISVFLNNDLWSSNPISFYFFSFLSKLEIIYQKFYLVYSWAKDLPYTNKSYYFGLKVTLIKYIWNYPIFPPYYIDKYFWELGKYLRVAIKYLIFFTKYVIIGIVHCIFFFLQFLFYAFYYPISFFIKFIYFFSIHKLFYYIFYDYPKFILLNIEYYLVWIILFFVFILNKIIIFFIILFKIVSWFLYTKIGYYFSFDIFLFFNNFYIFLTRFFLFQLFFAIHIFYNFFYFIMDTIIFILLYFSKLLSLQFFINFIYIYIYIRWLFSIIFIDFFVSDILSFFLFFFDSFKSFNFLFCFSIDILIYFKNPFLYLFSDTKFLYLFKIYLYLNDWLLLNLNDKWFSFDKIYKSFIKFPLDWEIYVKFKKARRYVNPGEQKWFICIPLTRFRGFYSFKGDHLLLFLNRLFIFDNLIFNKKLSLWLFLFFFGLTKINFSIRFFVIYSYFLYSVCFVIMLIILKNSSRFWFPSFYSQLNPEFLWKFCRRDNSSRIDWLFNKNYFHTEPFFDPLYSFGDIMEEFGFNYKNLSFLYTSPKLDSFYTNLLNKDTSHFFESIIKTASKSNEIIDQIIPVINRLDPTGYEEFRANKILNWMKDQLFDLDSNLLSYSAPHWVFHKEKGMIACFITDESWGEEYAFYGRLKNGFFLGTLSFNVWFLILPVYFFTQVLIANTVYISHIGWRDITFSVLTYYLSYTQLFTSTLDLYELIFYKLCIEHKPLLEYGRILDSGVHRKRSKNFNIVFLKYFSLYPKYVRRKFLRSSLDFLYLSPLLPRLGFYFIILNFLHVFFVVLLVIFFFKYQRDSKYLELNFIFSYNCNQIIKYFSYISLKLKVKIFYGSNNKT